MYGKNKMYSDDNTVEIVGHNYAGKVTGSALRTRIITYIAGDPYSAPAMYIKDFNGFGEVMSEGIHYLHRDYQGTISAISDQAGKVEERRLFDAWGNLVYLEKDGVKADLKKVDLLVERGYTGHEHFFQVGLIHMNGRMYDPKLHTFLSVDNYIQDPFSTQNYNRFGYVLNNPLMYTDPSGELFWMAILAGAIIGAVTGATSYIGQAIQTGGWNWGQFGMSILGGAVTGAILGTIAPYAVPTGTLGGFAFAGFAGSFMPSYNMDLGSGFSIGISPSMAFGNSSSLGLSLNMSYHKGRWGLPAGFSIAYQGKAAGSGTSFWERRYSGGIGYDDGRFGLSLYSTTFRGGGFDQRVGGLKIRHGDFSFRYENDGWPFDKKLTGFGFKKIWGDGNDSNRTAALHIGYKQFGIGFNLFTGTRYASSYEENNGHDIQEMEWTNRNGPKYGTFGESYPHGFVEEIGTTYRMGAVYMNVGGMRMGQDSDYFRHSIQDLGAHDINDQPGFPMMSNGYNNYFQYQTINSFTLW